MRTYRTGPSSIVGGTLIDLTPMIELLACGTSVVADDIGGPADMIEHGVSGRVAQPFDIAEFAEGYIGSWTVRGA